MTAFNEISFSRKRRGFFRPHSVVSSFFLNTDLIKSLLGLRSLPPLRCNWPRPCRSTCPEQQIHGFVQKRSHTPKPYIFNKQWWNNQTRCSSPGTSLDFIFYFLFLKDYFCLQLFTATETEELAHWNLLESKNNRGNIGEQLFDLSNLSHSL